MPTRDSTHFSVGMAAEYKSSTAGCWITANVLALEGSSGMYDLDCKQKVPVDRVRAVLEEPSGKRESHASDPGTAFEIDECWQVTLQSAGEKEKEMHLGQVVNRSEATITQSLQSYGSRHRRNTAMQQKLKMSMIKSG